MDAPGAVVMGGGGDMLEGMMAYQAMMVNQKPRGLCLEILCGCQPENEYNVHNPSDGSKILVAREQSNWCTRNVCGASRPFSMTIHTLDNSEIIRFERPFHPARKGGLFCCCLPFCFQTVRVFSGQATANPGKLLGWVREDYSWFQPTFSIFDANDTLVFKVIGDCCGCLNYTLRIFKPDNLEVEIGQLQKRWSGMMKEMFHIDNFVVVFPNEANAAHRALLLGATVLLDFLYFEKNQQNGGGGLDVQINL